jgi:Cytochrome c554 and c-prime
MRYSKYFNGTRLVIVAHMVVACLTVIMCDSGETATALSGVVHPNGKQFAGSESCASCHKNIAASHRNTPHYLTSRPASDATIKGSFEPGKNVLELNPQLKIVMEKTPAGFFQKGMVDGWEALKQSFDIVIGSGRKGQTYLYWKDDGLFQLPASYYAPLNVWCNSPGYPTDRILFNRTIPGRCLECHGTYFKNLTVNNTVDTFDQRQILFGVDCERCHGPSADHVRYQYSHPQEKTARDVINPSRLSRQQKLDNCALCHSGIREMTRPSFSFVVGDTLDHYSVPDYTPDSVANLDVHGNQYGLLTASRCFKMSSMDCSSCHNVHAKETNNLELFSQRCMKCHTPANHNFCTQPVLPGLKLSSNCIDCHMPALPSAKVLFQVTGLSTSTPDLVRTHRVGIYATRIKDYLDKMKAGTRQ